MLANFHSHYICFLDSTFIKRLLKEVYAHCPFIINLFTINFRLYFEEILFIKD